MALSCSVQLHFDVTSMIFMLTRRHLPCMALKHPGLFLPAGWTAWRLLAGGGRVRHPRSRCVAPPHSIHALPPLRSLLSIFICVSALRTRRGCILGPSSAPHEGGKEGYQQVKGRGASGNTATLGPGERNQFAAAILKTIARYKI